VLAGEVHAADLLEIKNLLQGQRPVLRDRFAASRTPGKKPVARRARAKGISGQKLSCERRGQPAFILVLGPTGFDNQLLIYLR
jgi:hypothetical protein